MKLPKIAIENYQFTLVMVLLIVVLGLASLLNMPRSEDPSFSFPAASIFVVYPGASPADIEQLVVDPVESALNELEDLKEVRTTIEEGFALLLPEFLAETDGDEKYDEVVDAVNGILGELPEGVLSPVIRKFTPDGVSILQIALVSPSAPYRVLRDEALDLKKALERDPGIKRVETWAYPEPEIQIQIDLEKMGRRRVTLPQIMGAVQSNNANIPGGRLKMGGKQFNIETSGNYESLDEIRNTVVHTGNGRLVYLKDVADVVSDYDELNYIGRFNGERAVFVTVAQQSGTNIFDVTERLTERIAEFDAHLPQDIQLAYAFNQSESVQARLDMFFGSLLQGLLLVGLVVLFVLGIRASSIVMVVIPVSILAAISIIDVGGFALQQMTIVGLMIALGLLVDNAIVVVENAYRFRRQGYSGKEAAMLGTQQVGWAIVSSTVTTVLAFLPMIFLGGGTGSFIRSMPITVVAALMASLLIALTLTPYLAARLLRNGNTRKTTWTQRGLNRVIEGTYRKTLGRAVRHPFITISLAAALLAGSFLLFPYVGVTLFPKAEKSQFLIDINTPEGTRLENTDAVVRFVESVLDRHEDVKLYAANVGRGNPRMYYNEAPNAEKSTYGQVLVEINSKENRDRTRVVQALRQTFASYPGAKITIKELMQGPGIEAPVAIRVVGENLDLLENLATEVETLMAGTVGTDNVDNPLSMPRTNLFVDINRDKAGMLGLALVDIDRTVRAGISGLPISTYRDPNGDEFDIVVRLPTVGDPKLSDFDRIAVHSQTGASIPLKQVADVKFKAALAQINHYNFERSVTITADVLDGYRVNAVTQEIIDQLDAFNWPDGYRYEIGGELAETQESFGGLLQAVLVAMFGIFGVLVLQFRSFGQPMIVFAAIPLAIIGAIGALFVTGNSFSFTAGVGLTSLVGIVINNAIILVDYANQLRGEGLSIVDAMQQAAEARFVPILLTTLTTIGGLLPLTLTGSTLWAPFGWAVIGGLITSMLLTLLLVPVLYKLFTQERVAVQ